MDLGLLRRDGAGGLTVANPLYREVLPRSLAGAPKDSLPSIMPPWLCPEGSLDPAALLDAFLACWRQHRQPLLSSTRHREIAPLGADGLPARVVPDPIGGGGTLEREYAIGKGRMELVGPWPCPRVRETPFLRGSVSQS